MTMPRENQRKCEVIKVGVALFFAEYKKFPHKSPPLTLGFFSLFPLVEGPGMRV